MTEDQIEIEVVYSDKYPNIPLYIVKPYILLINEKLGNFSSSDYTTDIPDRKLEEIIGVFDDVAEITGFYSGLEMSDLIDKINQKRNNDNNEEKQKSEIEQDIRYSLGLYKQLRKHIINNCRIISSKSFTQLETTKRNKHYLGSIKFMEKEIIFPQFIPIIYHPTQSNTFQRSSSQINLGQTHRTLPKNNKVARIDFKVR